MKPLHMTAPDFSRRIHRTAQRPLASCAPHLTVPADRWWVSSFPCSTDLRMAACALSSTTQEDVKDEKLYSFPSSPEYT